MQPSAIEPVMNGLDDSVFMDVIDSGGTERRVLLATQLSAFLGSEETPQSERDQAVPAMLKLAADPEIAVREALAAGLVTVRALNADLLFAIIADDDEISLPFLAATPSLGHWHMLAVLRVGDDARRATVALRPDISPEAVDYVIESLPLTVNALMLENEVLTLSGDQYRALYDRFGEEREILDILLARSDLPLDIRIGHARLTASRMQRLIIGRGWIPANGVSDLVADAEENAVLDILARTGPEERADVVSRLVDDELLTPSIIVRAACIGSMELVAEIMASLAGLSFKRARDAMFVKPMGAFKSLFAKSGLPQSCYWTLQAACDVAREENHNAARLPPEDFGRRMIEVLMTRYESLPREERPKQLDFVGRFAADRTRLIARRLKADLLRAA
jgi:uncharacterized protein (DUF2336 family)